MSINVKKREFLSKNSGDLKSVCWEVSMPEVTEEYSYPNMTFKISDGSDVLYFEVWGKTKKELNDSLGELVALRDHLDDFIELIKDNQVDILKAYVN